MKTGYVTEIFFDGDNKTANIKEAEYIEIEKAFKRLADSLKPAIEAICEIGKKCVILLMQFLKILNIC